SCKKVASQRGRVVFRVPLRVDKETVKSRDIPFRHSKDREAFTLIELLVVVAVIATLSAMLLPALCRARGTAKAATCCGHLKQWGLATQIYAAENDDFLPPE